MSSPIEQFEPFFVTPLIDSAFLIYLSLVSFFYLVGFRILIVTKRDKSQTVTPVQLGSKALLIKDVVTAIADYYVWAVDGLLSANGIPTRYFGLSVFFYIIPISILFFNLYGLLPLSFTVTSHFIFVLFIVLLYFTHITLVGIRLNGLHIINLFTLPGVPNLLAFMLFKLEILSFLARILSLSIRLFANLMSSHLLLSILTKFITSDFSFFGLVDAAVAGVISCLVVIDLGIVFLQAYIFSILLVLYKKDLFSGGH